MKELFAPLCIRRRRQLQGKQRQVQARRGIAGGLRNRRGQRLCDGVRFRRIGSLIDQQHDPQRHLRGVFALL